MSPPDYARNSIILAGGSINTATRPPNANTLEAVGMWGKYGHGVGGPGGGGGQTTSANSGGDGYRGGGGGGGGGSLNGITAGNGGAGGNGYVVIWSY